ncbi:hypothetical protein Hamer_G001497 [Homarus americanus]|uniref:Uncharacterized protein n=1 Tax=Homarus americanus TaxID=6706 RepID=A0A8J5TIJ2_HOMAM|nr:hypothetical protein Hamer_G001497 [Homarus americanus]
MIRQITTRQKSAEYPAQSVTNQLRSDVNITWRHGSDVNITWRHEGLTSTSPGVTRSVNVNGSASPGVTRSDVNITWRHGLTPTSPGVTRADVNITWRHESEVASPGDAVHLASRGSDVNITWRHGLSQHHWRHEV